MPKKNVENATTTPAAPKAPAPMPAFFADFVISVLASSISARTSVDMSAIALCTSAPTVGSSVPATPAVPLGWALWATVGSSSVRRVPDRDARQQRRAYPLGVSGESCRMPHPAHSPVLVQSSEALLGSLS